MKIAMFASEAVPYAKSGGLGDVMHALPQALAQQMGNEVCLFLPLYRCIKQNDALELEYLTNFEINLAWRRQYVGLARLRGGTGALQIYFVDNEYYFDRDGLYGYADDGERFAYFSRAALSCMNYLEYDPDVVQCNDWQTALIPLLLKTEFSSCFGKAKSVFTIHNVEYQGWAAPEFYDDVLGLPGQYRWVLMKDGGINLMKGAIVMADAVSTVSKTYARELLYDYHAHGMDGILRENQFKLHGIINGIDPTYNDPAKDACLAANYTAATMRQKKPRCKAALQKQLGLEVRPDIPVLAMVTRLVQHKGIDLLCYILDRLMERPVQLVITGTGDSGYEQTLRQAAERYPGKLSVNLCFSTQLANQIYAGCDIYLMPSKSEPCGLSQMIAMHYGAVPVVNAIGGLKDTVWPYEYQTKQGRGFTFQSFNGDDFLAAIDRALGLYYDVRQDWDSLAQRNMREDFSWNVPAGHYMQLFTDLCRDV